MATKLEGGFGGLATSVEPFFAASLKHCSENTPGPASIWNLGIDRISGHQIASLGWQAGYTTIAGYWIWYPERLSKIRTDHPYIRMDIFYLDKKISGRPYKWFRPDNRSDWSILTKSQPSLHVLLAGYERGNDNDRYKMESWTSSERNKSCTISELRIRIPIKIWDFFGSFEPGLNYYKNKKRKYM